MRIIAEKELQGEVLLAVEDCLGVLDGVVGQGDGADCLGKANGFLGGTHVDVTAGCVTASAADVDLVMQAGKEVVSVSLGTASANQAGATGGTGSDSQALGRSLTLDGCGRVDLDEVGTQAQSNASSTSDKLRSLLVGDGSAARVNPQNYKQALFVSLGDKLTASAIIVDSYSLPR